MSLLSLRALTYTLGGAPLLDRADLSVEAQERLCLVGRNGAGKSTLMRLIAGELQADDGEIVRQGSLRVAYLGQEIPRDVRGSVYEVIADGLGELGALLAEYHRLSESLGNGAGEDDLTRLERVQHALEAQDGWNLGARVDAVVSRLDLPGEAAFDALSGGLKRRVLLGRALVTDPELLLLDEPTNHLDIEAIEWLEDFLRNFPGAVMLVTHDRAFADALATAVLDLDRGKLTRYACGYREYVRRKAEDLEVEAAQAAEFDRRLGIEETWIRQGIKARRTRNEGRVRALKAMREEHRERRVRTGQARLAVDVGGTSGKLVAEAEGASIALGGRTIVRDLNLTLLRGDKLGIIGPNGAGKTTLLRLLTGALQPDTGHVRLGTQLSVAYFDQQREQLDPESTVVDAVGEGSTQVTVNGQSKHIMGYLQDFLFSPARARTPIRALSGGERNRLLLAKLFTRPANLLIMDEPTNDLDVETLELLEGLLVEYTGTLILVSHDRVFLDNVVTSTLAFEGDGYFAEYVGGYQDWLRQRPGQAAAKATTAAAKPVQTRDAPAAAAKPARKLSYKDQRELDALPGKIAALESEQETLENALASPDLYRDAEEVRKTRLRHEAVVAELEAAFARWEKLESTAG
ncbi:ABC transporter ATP-binding protein [Acidihalobacter aeolianus]|uniref:ATP-binding protein Uup n=1 Tax=Acidihalobacter aeolianus TaxID=2792603 RepID=A0A1D8K6F1_9GAMM|nr:ATP-binding cassette domain-containing protein [Acidihalobacter aeolianus]AOV16514.1 ABC transporter ATP-binding protein [Acidihalobacter aeolianus]